MKIEDLKAYIAKRESVLKEKLNKKDGVTRTVTELNHISIRLSELESIKSFIASNAEVENG